MKTLSIIALLICSYISPVQAKQAQSVVFALAADGHGEKVGTISFTDTAAGLLIREEFSGLPPGPHGIHVHERGSCGAINVVGKNILGGAAGGHYDPHRRGKHAGPNSDGHKGDLPVLMVDSAGKAMNEFYLSGLNAAEFQGRAVVIHRGGDNYQDEPEPLGGGGDRIACGLIE